MNNDQVKEKIKDIFASHQLVVISTLDSENNKPESALIAFAEKDDFSLFFGTSNLSRKYANLQKNNKVSFVIGWDKEVGSVQYEGIARELTDEEAVHCSELMALKNKQTEKYVVRSDQRYFHVTPTWIRLIDSSVETSGKYELSFAKN
jgi:general stress protein 26